MKQNVQDTYRKDGYPMKSFRQLLRQPAQFISGILIVALAVAILVACVGQYTATGLTSSDLDDRYNTVALLSDTYFWQENGEGKRTRLPGMPDEIQEWIDDTIQNRTDLVQMVSAAGLVSAYIPDMNIDNFSQYEDGNLMGDYNIGNPYRSAMLEVTLTEIGTVVNRDVSTFVVNDAEQELLNYVSVLCVGTVDRVLGLEQGYESPVGNRILLTVVVYSEEDFDNLQLQIGQRYLIYGMDYSDMGGRELENQIMNHLTAYEELFGEAPVVGPSLELNGIMEQIDCTMTVSDDSALPWNTRVSDENGGFASLTDERPFYYIESGNYYITSVPAEEYMEDYRVPTIAALDGTAEEFLASDAGDLWKEALEEMNISNHGFPVLAVDKLGYQAAFCRNLARIVAGRDFSESERAGGERVCIISESLATANGLQVGDVIEWRTYAYDPNIEIQREEMRSSTAFPSAAIYSDAMGFTSEMEEYVIVGLYRLEDAWQNQNDPYGFTPNTIFVPKTAVSGEMITHADGIYSMLVIRNGKMEQFLKLQEDAGYPELFVCYDSGYSEIVTALSDYGTVSARTLYIGLAVYAAMMLLFILLFPARQGKTLAIMCSLGAGRGKQMGHLLTGTMAVLIPGTVIGGTAGALLWRQVASALMKGLEVEIPVEANMLVTAPVLAAIHMALICLAVSLVGIRLTGRKSLMGRK